MHKCVLCGVRRKPGCLYIVRLMVSDPVLICWWCTDALGKIFRDAPRNRRSGIEGATYSDKFINEEQMIPYLRREWLERLRESE